MSSQSDADELPSRYCCMGVVGHESKVKYLFTLDTKRHTIFKELQDQSRILKS